MHEVTCVACPLRAPSEPTLARVAAGDDDPACPDCGGILKLAVVMFGEDLDADTLGKARRIAANSGLMLAAGSSLRVEPVASLCALAVEAGGRLVIVNRDPTPYDDLAVEVIREPIGTALPRICAYIRRSTETTRPSTTARSPSITS